MNIGTDEHTGPPHKVRGRSPTNPPSRQGAPGVPLHPAPVRQFPLAGKRSDSNSSEVLDKPTPTSSTTTTRMPSSSVPHQISFSSLLSEFGLPRPQSTRS